jgi:hypothetical protein
MIVYDFDVVGVVVKPLKANTPLIVDTDAVLSPSIATEFFKPVG